MSSDRIVRNVTIFIIVLDVHGCTIIIQKIFKCDSTNLLLQSVVNKVEWL